MRKRVIILGGSSGIGKTIAERFAKEGWLVIVGSNDLVSTQIVVEGLEGEGHVALRADVTSDEQIENLKKLIQEQYITFHVLINSVGISKGVPVLNSEFSEWDHSLQVMLYGAIKACRALVPLIEEGGYYGG